MKNTMKKRDFVSLRDLSSGEIRELFSQAFAIKAQPARYSGSLTGKALAMIFDKPSLRTRVTFEVGMHQMGGFCIHLTPAEIRLGERESASDVAHNLERMVQGIVIRTFSHEVVEKIAGCAHVPVINGLTDFSHPCQGLADYMTMTEVKGDLPALKIAFVGDGNNVAHSLIFGAARLGLRLAVATPHAYQPKSEVVAWALGQSTETGCRLELTQDPAEAVSGADVVYTDVWASMGQESESDRRRAVFRPYQVNEALFELARPDAIFMHCLPARRGEEVTEGVIDSSRSVVFQQAENRLHLQKALLLHLLG
jgi:ornithine carbamoyltransferase